MSEAATPNAAISGTNAVPSPDELYSKLSVADMCVQLGELTGEDVAAEKQNYEALAVRAHMEIKASEFFDELSDLRESLAGATVAGKIRGIESWADGTDELKHVYKSWESFVDKLYRINIEENSQPGEPPHELTTQERAAKLKATQQLEWVTVANAHAYVDDIVRTKLVVPFADAVSDISDRLKGTATSLNLPNYRRYHAKDSGYHAHHVYVLIPVLGADGAKTEVTFEIKVLTKLQDTLGELTHLLYELKRTKRLTPQKKRKLAWMFDEPDFIASYVGHTAHYVEASLVGLKAELDKLEGNPSAKP